MADSTIILKRKVQIFIDSDIKADRERYYEKLFSWRDIVYKGANLVISHLYILEKLQDMVYLEEGTKIKLADRQKEENGILNCSRMGASYKLLSKLYLKQIPMNIMACVSQKVLRDFATDRQEYWLGNRSIRNYKRTMPIPFSGDVFTIKNDESNYDFKFKLFKIPFRTYLGKDKSDKRVLLKKVVAGQIKVCESAIQIIKGKIFMLIALELPIKKKELDVYQIAEAALGIEHPITVHVGKNSLQIGTKEEFMYRRLAIQASRQRLQRSCRYTKGGKGRTKKLKALEQFEKKELQYIDSKLHLYSRRLIDFCIKTRSGNLLLTDQKAKEEKAKEDDLILRNWSYYGLIEKIKYKANMAGINVIVE